MFIKIRNKHKFIDSIVNNVDDFSHQLSTSTFYINIVINSDDKTMLAKPDGSLAVCLQIELLCLACKIRVDITDFKKQTP